MYLANLNFEIFKKKSNKKESYPFKNQYKRKLK